MTAIHINQELFNNYIVEGTQPILVEYWAPWCVYCRRIAPAFHKISEQYRDELLTGQINIDEEPLLTSKEQIEVVPTFILYHGGQVLGSIVAPESKAQIDAFIKETLQK